MGHTEQELDHIEIIKEYMLTTYDPKRAGADSVRHLCAPRNRFIAPTTFPEIHTMEQYAEEHSKLAKQLNDLRINNFDVLFAKDNRVCLRFSAEGSHNGEPHGEIQPTLRRANWDAAAIFRLENGKIAEFIKEWNKLSMWEQLGWPPEECLVFANPEFPAQKAA